VRPNPPAGLPTGYRRATAGGRRRRGWAGGRGLPQAPGLGKGPRIVPSRRRPPLVAVALAAVLAAGIAIAVVASLPGSAASPRSSSGPSSGSSSGPSSGPSSTGSSSGATGSPSSGGAVPVSAPAC